MSSRPGHSHAAMRRYMQMSRGHVYIFVEGRDLDPHVYAKICAPVCKAAGKPHEVVIADRIAGGGGGKTVLKKLFEYLRDNKSLLARSTPVAKLAMFYLDKDVNDLFGTLIVSDHVVYPPYYNIENHLFHEGDLVSSIAIGGSIDAEVIRKRIPNPGDWRVTAADCWFDWIAVCILARKLSLSHPVSYAFPNSRINSPTNAKVDDGKLKACVAEMRTRAKLSLKEFD